MRCQRTMMSSRVTKSVWPLCRPPVTLGGGIVITNGSRLPQFGCDSGRNRSCLTQKSYQCCSVSAGLYGAYASPDRVPSLLLVVVTSWYSLHGAKHSPASCKDERGRPWYHLAFPLSGALL